MHVNDIPEIERQKSVLDNPAGSLAQIMAGA
jgi:hypothetical protein